MRETGYYASWVEVLNLACKAGHFYNQHGIMLAIVTMVFFCVGCEQHPSGRKELFAGNRSAVEKAVNNPQGSKEGYFLNMAGIKMIWIPPGEFLMGYQRASDDAPATDELQDLERLRHVIISTGFWMSSTEVTVEQYGQVINNMAKERHEIMSSGFPVTSITWTDAVRFCEILSVREGRRYRLPTVEEWEYACRGGPSGGQLTGKFSLKELAWYTANSDGKLQLVASLAPNQLGLYDMLGNAWEWCGTRVPQKYVSTTPFKGRDCAFIRGGSYKNTAKSCDCGSAYAFIPIDSSDPTYGFRIVCIAR